MAGPDQSGPDGLVLDPSEVVAAAGLLRRGGLVAFPTETVYGLGADADAADAVRRIFEVKGRPAGHPLIVHLAHGADLGRWAAAVPPSARLLAEAFWPGPLTLIVARAARVPDVVTGGRSTVGLRVPDHPVAQALLAAFGGGVAAPSANRFGRVSPTTAADVVAEVGERLEPGRDAVLDGGPCRVGVESTIVDCTGAEPELLRPGGVSAERLAEVLGGPVPVWRGEGPARAPGMLAAHYAPRARVEVVGADEVVARARFLAAAGDRVGTLAPVHRPDLPPEVVELEPAGDVDEYAHHLYARLRQADRLSLDVVLVVPPPDEGVGRAVRDRLVRAARGSQAGGAADP